MTAKTNFLCPIFQFPIFEAIDSMKRKPADPPPKQPDFRGYESAIDEILSDLKTSSMSSLHLPFTAAYVARKRGSLTKADHSRHKPPEHRSTKKLQFSAGSFDSGRRVQEQPRLQIREKQLGKITGSSLFCNTVMNS